MTGYKAGQGEVLSCPACGASLQAGEEEQFFCGHCGAPLAREPEEALLPDWLDEPEPTATPLSPPARLVLQPKTPRRQRAAERADEGSGPSPSAVVIFVLVGLLCLGLALVALVGLGLVSGG